ncbi:hypothetical protein Hanom_Chr00s000001g01594251 [Helianthus anomalus]
MLFSNFGIVDSLYMTFIFNIWVVKTSTLDGFSGKVDGNIFFFERSMNPSNGILVKFTTSGYTCFPNRGKPSPRAEAREHSPEGTIVR